MFYISVSEPDLDRVLDSYFEEAFQRKPHNEEREGFYAYVECDIPEWIKQNANACLQLIEPDLSVIYSRNPEEDEAIRKEKRTARFREELR